MSDRPLNRILHVDDEQDIREVAKLALEGVGGFTLESCESGAEALEKLPGFNPDMILLDIMMPGMDGPSTLEALRKLPEAVETPVVFMTAKVQAHELKAFGALGVVDVIVKPFDPMTLSDRVREIWSSCNDG